jgi:cytochrome c oxidase assembly factor CtaG
MHKFFVLAHADAPHDLPELLGAWEWNFLVIAMLLSSAVLYGRGTRRLWRSSHPGGGIRRWEAACYWGGILSLFLALVSPLHAMGHILFSAHMIQHEILMLISAPLLVLGRPLIVYLWALPPGISRGLARASREPWWRSSWKVLSHPFTAWLLHAIALWIWHIPVLFQATLDNDLIHTMQHASFLGSALLFWWAVTNGRHRLAGYGMAVLYMFTTALHSGLLGALITFARHNWYPTNEETLRWRLTPLEDQQLGGLIMWIPAGVVYVIAGLLFVVGWMREADRRVRIWEASVSPATRI